MEAHPTIVSLPPVASTVDSAPVSNGFLPLSTPKTSSLLNSVTHAASAVTSATNTLASATGDFSVFNSLSLVGKNHGIPDRSVASQVLMFRQLLHTACKPGLRLSRAYQGTAAQRAVMHMPWWELGVEQTGRMVISYDNLITRLWLNAGVLPFMPDISSSPECPPAAPLAEASHEIRPSSAALARAVRKGILPIPGPSCLPSPPPPQEEPGSSVIAPQSTLRSLASSTSQVSSLVTEKGLPPIPHEYWVSRIGFQQEDPVTDFRSGGVLSLAMLVYIVESCPATHRRFLPGGEAGMLPFAITSVNVTDMLAKFLMLSKSVDRIDALLSSKPFWRMFADPNTLLVLQELSLDILGDVVVEKGAALAEGEKITVFDFPTIMEVTEKRVKDDLLGAGPRSVNELRHLATRLRSKNRSARPLPSLSSSLPSPSAIAAKTEHYGKKMLDANNYRRGMGKVAAAFSGFSGVADSFFGGFAAGAATQSRAPRVPPPGGGGGVDVPPFATPPGAGGARDQPDFARPAVAVDPPPGGKEWSPPDAESAPPPSFSIESFEDPEPSSEEQHVAVAPIPIPDLLG